MVNIIWSYQPVLICYSIYPDNVELRVGSVDRHDGGHLVPVHDFYIHPDYNYEADNDIAVIRLERNLEFSDLIQPILLATRRPEAWEKAIVSGWGYGLVSKLGPEAFDLVVYCVP